MKRPVSIPQRTCVACRRTGAKREFVRLVRTPESTVAIDLTGKKAGRGAYLCRDQRCWDMALRRSRLSSALKGPLTAGEIAALREFAATLGASAPAS